MAVISLKTNVAALSTQRYMARNASEKQFSLERLSTGLRINHASDDAAGLALSSKLNVNERVYNQGVRNINDAISVLNVAQGAVEGLTSILTRLRELTTQAANGTLGLQQRRALNEEADQMVAEYNRIVGSVEFNNRKLLDGNFNQLGVQAGYGSDGTLVFNLGEDLSRETGTGGFSLALTLAGGTTDRYLETADINGDGNQDIISSSSGDSSINVQLGNGDGTFQALTAYATGLSGTGALAIADFNGDGKLDVLTGKYSNVTVANEMAIAYGNGDGTLQAFTTFNSRAGSTAGYVEEIEVADIDGDSDLDFIFSGKQTTTGANYYQIVTNNGDNTFSVGTSSFLGGLFNNVGLELGDINGDGILDLVTAYNSGANGTVTASLGNGDGTFRSGTSYNSGLGAGTTSALELVDSNRDGILDIISNIGNGDIGVRLGKGDGTFELNTRTDYSAAINTFTMADINNDGMLDIFGSGYTLFAKEDGTYSAPVSSGAATANHSADLNNDGVLEALSNDTTSLFIFNPTIQDTGSIAYLNLLSQESALSEYANLDEAMARITQEVSNIGANESRLHSAMKVLSQIRLESAAARSRIEDADIADESSRVVRLSILEQAGVAVQSQANQSPALALTLINAL